MFFGKRQQVNVLAAPGFMPQQQFTQDQMMQMPDGQMMMGPAAETAGFVPTPGHFMHTGAGMPGFEVSGYAGPGMAETIHATKTEFGSPCLPGHFEHTEFDVDIEPRPRRHVHVVRKGETVYKIAMRYGLDWRELAGYNRLGNPDLIYPGQRLEIPPRY